jgi:hypothetical protein
VASKGLTVYGTWKTAEVLESKGTAQGRLYVGMEQEEQEEKVFGLKDVTCIEV